MEEQWKQVGIRQLYNQVLQMAWVSSSWSQLGDKMLAWDPAADRGLWALSDPWFSNPAKMRKKCCYGQKNFGQYVAVCPRLQLTSHTQPTSTLSRIKCERYIFIKKWVRSFIDVHHYVWLCYAYNCMVVSTQHMYRFYLHKVKCQNISILNNSI